MTQTITAPRTQAAARSCDATTSVTRSLLGYGVLAGPLYLVVSFLQALTRDGFDLTRHAFSLLSNGDLGWIQITNFVLFGLMTVASAVGMRRALRGGRGGTWGPRLIGAFGLGTVGGGVFLADPMDGFPIGAPAGAPVVISWHGILHMVSAGVGFFCLIAACFVLASTFARRGQRGWAWYSRVTGLVFLAGFAGVSSGAGGAAAVVAFYVAVVVAFTWLSAVAAHLYRRA
jgi:hypothetical membrane protein